MEMIVRFVSTIFILFGVVYSSKFCPKECDCDLYADLNRAVCQHQNIISVEIGVPSDVEIYDLSHNAVYELESFQLRNLNYNLLADFDLSYNNLVWIGINAFAGLHQLRRVNLSNNRLRAIAPDIFWDNSVIEEVDFSGNIFHMLKNVPFLSHSGLQILNLNECRIAHFPPKVFKALPNLRSLDISENYNLGLAIETLSPLFRLTKLKIDNEYLKCTTEVKELEQWIVSRDISYKIKCNKHSENQFERMTLGFQQENEKKIQDIDGIWCNRTPKILEVGGNKTEDLFVKFNKIPAIWTLVMGFQIGLVLGIIFTYLCLSNCSKSEVNLVRNNKELSMLSRMENRPFLTPSQIRSVHLLSPKKNNNLRRNILVHENNNAKFS